MTNIIIFSFIIMLASLIGIFSVWRKAGEAVERNLHFLVSFSAGVFLVIALGLGWEVFEHSEHWEKGLLWIIVGAFGLWFMFRILPFFHHHHDESAEGISHTGIDARRILISDAIHNFGDGILLSTAFAVDFTLGLATAISIFIHELVQEMSEFFVLRQAGYSTQKALAFNFLVSSTILIGAVGSFFLMKTFEIFEVPLLGISAGAFLVVVGHDLIPHAIKSPAFKVHYLKHIGWFILGLILMFALNLFITH